MQLALITPHLDKYRLFRDDIKTDVFRGADSVCGYVLTSQGSSTYSGSKYVWFLDSPKFSYGEKRQRRFSPYLSIEGFP